MHSALITGGQGFIGGYLADELRRRGVRVTTIGRRPSRDPSHVVLDDVAWTEPFLDKVLEDAMPDCIFHLAGQVHGSASELARVNTDLAQALLDALRRTGRRPRLIVAGSAAEYGASIKDGEPVRETLPCAPKSAYGMNKYAQTQAVLAFAEATGIQVTVARIFNVFGPNMPTHLAIGDFVSQIASMHEGRGTLNVGNINVRRDMIDVEDVARVLCDLAVHPDAGGVVNVCSGKAPLLRELVEMLIACSGRSVKIEVDWARIRGNEPQTIVGSIERLAKLGCASVTTDFAGVIGRICRSMGDATAQSSSEPSSA